MSTFIDRSFLVENYKKEEYTLLEDVVGKYIGLEGKEFEVVLDTVLPAGRVLYMNEDMFHFMVTEYVPDKNSSLSHYKHKMVIYTSDKLSFLMEGWLNAGDKFYPTYSPSFDDRYNIHLFKQMPEYNGYPMNEICDSLERRLNKEDKERNFKWFYKET